MRLVECSMTTITYSRAPVRVRTSKGYEEQKVSQPVHRGVVEQAGRNNSVGVGECGPADLALGDQQLVPQREDLDVQVRGALHQLSLQVARIRCTLSALVAMW